MTHQSVVLERPDATAPDADLELRQMPAEFFVWKNEGGAFLPED